ncbi:MAG: hypothetical protein JSR77_05445 [Planctomycetes bacterium]|nr:hypothetical protein [Planctomycetota bacterium]
MTRNTLLVTATALFLAAGCEKQPEAPAAPAAAPKTQAPPAAPSKPAAATPAPATPTPAPAAAAMGPTVTAMNLTFKLPDGWKQGQPSNSMRLAEAAVADPSGDAGKACTVAFSTAGGDVQSNIGRWANQVQDASGQAVKADPKKKTVAGLPVTTVELTGKYMGMGDGQPKPDWTMRAAIVESPEGLLFIKMTGPADRMKTLAAGFDSLVDSMTKK